MQAGRSWQWAVMLRASRRAVQLLPSRAVAGRTLPADELLRVACTSVYTHDPLQGPPTQGYGIPPASVPLEYSMQAVFTVGKPFTWYIDTVPYTTGETTSLPHGGHDTWHALQ